MKHVARQLGVGYLLEGSVRKTSNRVRITGQLIEATTGSHIWADRFDGAPDDIFELQDRVASSVLGAVEPKLLLAEVQRAKRKPTENLDAITCTCAHWRNSIAIAKKDLLRQLALSGER